MLMNCKLTIYKLTVHKLTVHKLIGHKFITRVSPAVNPDKT